MLLACSNMTLPDSWSSSGACHPPCVKPPSWSSSGSPSTQRRPARSLAVVARWCTPAVVGTVTAFPASRRRARCP
jgi:hypothetical protein